MRKKIRATIGIYHPESHQLVAFVCGKTFDTHAEGKQWALNRLHELAPSPYMYDITVI